MHLLSLVTLLVLVIVVTAENSTSRQKEKLQAGILKRIALKSKGLAPQGKRSLDVEKKSKEKQMKSTNHQDESTKLKATKVKKNG